MKLVSLYLCYLFAESLPLFCGGGRVGVALVHAETIGRHHLPLHFGPY